MHALNIVHLHVAFFYEFIEWIFFLMEFLTLARTIELFNIT